MEMIKKMESMDVGSWRTTLVSLLPLWLLSFAILPEGLPGLPIPIRLAGIIFFLVFAVGALLLWKGWATAEVLLYSLFPILLAFNFDEMSAAYKTPFILLCAIFLSLGIVGYQYSLRRDVLAIGWLILLLVIVVTWVFASHANQNYWQMVTDLGIHDCSTDYDGCASLAGRGTSWLLLFFHL